MVSCIPDSWANLGGFVAQHPPKRSGGEPGAARLDHGWAMILPLLRGRLCAFGRHASVRSDSHSGRKLKAPVLCDIDLRYVFVWFETHTVM